MTLTTLKWQCFVDWVLYGLDSIILNNFVNIFENEWFKKSYAKIRQNFNYFSTVMIFIYNYEN